MPTMSEPRPDIQTNVDSPGATDSNRSCIIGIDLGTTNSLVAVADDHGPRILNDAGGHAIVPSVVRFPEGSAGEPIIGREARAHLVEFPAETVYSVKRLMGKSVTDVTGDLEYLGYQVVQGEHDTARVRIGDRIISPQEVSALILQKLREVAENALGHQVREAVITVPAYFDDAQRQATRDAGRIAGLEVKRIVNEPTAAALAYGLGHGSKQETIAVYDLGGGTFDISILQIIPHEAAEDSTDDSAQLDSFFQVVSTSGDTHLGGDDVDRMIVELVEREIREEFGMELTFPPSTRQALRQFSEATKIRLSEFDQAEIQVDLGEERVYQRVLLRDEFEGMIRSWVDRSLACCTRALRDAGMKPDQIDRVVMVGGSTRIPLVRQMLGTYFDAEPYTALDPDKVVALGAAVQGSILAGSHTNALLLDVIPLSLGIETMGGAVAKLVMRNSMVPCQAKEMFSTSVDGQTSIKIHILQGEREMVADCRSLGEFHLRGIPPMPAGIPKLEVTFHIDANGILNVSAVEMRSGKRAAIQIVPNHGLARDEVDQMELESYKFAREDMKLHRVVDLRVNAALDIKWISERMGKLGNAIDDDYRAALQQHLDTLTDFIEQSEDDPQSVDADAFLKAKQSLDEASVRLHEISIAQSLRDERATSAQDSTDESG